MTDAASAAFEQEDQSPAPGLKVRIAQVWDAAPATSWENVSVNPVRFQSKTLQAGLSKMLIWMKTPDVFLKALALCTLRRCFYSR